MPVTIPAALAAKFVSKSSLQTRIKVLQNSYKAQFTGMTIFSVANFDKNILIQSIKTIGVFPFL